LSKFSKVEVLILKFFDKFLGSFLLVSKDGTIVARDLRGEDLEAKLAELMK
jgi:hypothetical protein